MPDQRWTKRKATFCTSLPFFIVWLAHFFLQLSSFFSSWTLSIYLATFPETCQMDIDRQPNLVASADIVRSTHPAHSILGNWSL